MTDAFGEELRRWRVRAGLSLAELASRVHYSKSHLSNIERGRKHGTVELAERCDAALQADGHLIGVMLAYVERTEAGRTVKPAQLPAGIGYFVGRAAELAQLDSLLVAFSSNQSVPIVAIGGMPGVGKTAVAIRWAHEQALRFPDGMLFADLHGCSPERAAPPEDVLAQFLSTLGIPGGSVPDALTARSALYRSVLDGRRMLIVLDNAASPEQVRPLLPGSTESVVLVTSRNRLSGLAVREGAARLTLQPLPSRDAVSLLENLLGNDRVNAEPDAAALLVEYCAYLPLALRIAAERLASNPRTSLAQLADDLTDENARLNVFAVDDDESSALRKVFSWSYRALPTASARMFQFASVHPGPDITPPAAAALTGVSIAEATRTLDQLASFHLLDEHASNRYGPHPLLNVYAAERLRVEGRGSAGAEALNRVMTWYLHTAATAAAAIDPYRRHLKLTQPDWLSEAPHVTNREDALSWCDVELENLVAAVHASAEGHLDEFTWQLPLALGAHFDLRKAWQPWIITHHLGLSAARRQGNRVAEAWLLTNLASAYGDQRRLHEARDLLEESLAIQREMGDRPGEASSLIQLARTFTAMTWFDKALAGYRAALQVLPEVKDQHGEATALAGVAEVYCTADQYQLAREPVETALAIFRRLKDRRGEGMALSCLATIYNGMGYPDEAVAEFNQALDALRDAGDRWGEAVTLDRRGQALRKIGEPDTASSSLRDALAIFEQLDDPRAAIVRAQLHGPGIGPSIPNDQAS